MSNKAEHTEEYRRALVNEALTRTPRGGFPELEVREGLKPGTLFDWVEALGPRWEMPFSALHFWIGTTSLSEEDFWRYFEHADSYWELDVDEVESADRDVTGCGFCVDVGMRFLYDDDLMQVIWFEDRKPIRTVIDESTIETDAATDVVVAACVERGMTEANAAFVYADPHFVVPNPARLFNGLPYLGKFRSKASNT